jgi:hypothetical protein
MLASSRKRIGAAQPGNGWYCSCSTNSPANLEDVQNALRRHTRGDWGEVPAEDARANDAAMLEGCRLLSAFRDRRGVKFWISFSSRRRRILVCRSAKPASS